MAGAARSVARPDAQAGTPITNEQARAAKRPGVGLGVERGESARVVGDGTPFAIDTGEREPVRLFFARIYQEPTPPIGWTGVALPARGFIPYSTVCQRWSLSYRDADFSQAWVSVTRDGVALNLAFEPLVQGYGENRIVWEIPDIGETDSHASPQGDVRYPVSVSNVLVAQRAPSLTTASPGWPRPS